MFCEEDSADTEYSHRTAEVQQWQLFYGMVPRTDSRLTDLYARKQSRLRADEVARELFATDYIYRESLYGEVIEEYMRCVAGLVRKSYPEVSWTKTWEIVRFFGPPALKLSLCKTCDLRIPDLPSCAH